MIDHVNSAKRSEIMRLVPRQGSSAEMLVRRIVWRLGYRYRLNLKSLPGTPDLVFKRRRKVIFVHGCFWHGHENCSKAMLPKSNVEYWEAKISKNRDRDRRVVAELVAAGWSVLVVWQCELRSPQELSDHIDSFLADK
ncbi:DNA mismatch endonuclease Vsr [Burkholderia cepacia]|uniref:very short patch repair endonuclease n=1 Tax=Burkholderia cepacia TaxID=292 RepID=UPI0013F3CDE7|nr:very short patch repair endonuclease [Burkholderia cepacia]NHB12212.1 DNA mismatch endonuclease Vsr [Burkholderia cepacia]